MVAAYQWWPLCTYTQLRVCLHFFSAIFSIFTYNLFENLNASLSKTLALNNWAQLLNPFLPGFPLKGQSQTVQTQIRLVSDQAPEVIKLYSCSMLNSVEHEILNAHKYKSIKKFGFFKSQISLECYFTAHKCENASNYEQEKSCSVELSMKKVL